MALYTTRLLLLGVTRIFGPAHGYMLLRELQSWDTTKWTNIRAGSVYSGLRTLVKEGYAETLVGAENKQSSDPTLFRLTAKGRSECLALTRRSLSEVDFSQRSSIFAGVIFMPFLHREEVLGLLEQRRQALHSLNGSFADHFRSSEVAGGQAPPHVQENFRFGCSQVEAELNWVESLAERIRNGEYYFNGEHRSWEPPENDPVWKGYHRIWPKDGDQSFD